MKNTRAYRAGYSVGFYAPAFALAALAAVALRWCVGCNIPDPDDLHLAECLRDANTQARACLDGADSVYQAGGDPKTYAQSAETCGLNLVDSIADCVDQAQEVLR
jgi:hypothetical protein